MLTMNNAHPAHRRRSRCSRAIAALAPDAATAQVMMPVPPQSQPVVLRGATIHTVTKGTIQNGTIVLESGKITAIGGADVADAARARRSWT